jgi:hypothetical protein
MTWKPLRSIGASGQAQAMRLWRTECLIKYVGERTQVFTCRLTFTCSEEERVGKGRGKWNRLRPTAAASLLSTPSNEWPQPSIWRRDERRNTRWPLKLCRSNHKVICANLIKVQSLRRCRLHSI